MITSTRSTPVQIFISIRSAGASPQIGEILQFCDFFVILYFFLGTHPGRTVDRFSRFMARTTCFRPSAVLFGGCDNIGIHLRGNIPQKLTQKGSE